VLAADILSSALYVSAAAHASASLSAILSWSVFAVLAHGLVVLLLDLLIYRAARLRLIGTKQLLGAVVLEVACVLATSQFISAQFREVVSPVAGVAVSAGFGEFADAVYSQLFTPLGFTQLLLFLLCFLLFLSLARLLFSAEFAALDVARTGCASVRLQQIDSPALAVSYAGYCCAHSLILAGLLECVAEQLSAQLASMCVWMAIGATALLFAQATSNQLLLRGVRPGALLREGNLAVAIADLGHSVASGLIIGASASGDASFVLRGIASFACYFAISLALFVLFSWLYQLATRYDDARLVAEGNVAAALGHCVSQVALGYMLASPIYTGASLPQFAYQAALSMAVLLLSRVYVDKLLLPRRALDAEVELDRNWGAALIEGGFALGVAVFVEALLPRPLDDATCNQVLAALT
jgi:putative membrane protein